MQVRGHNILSSLVEKRVEVQKSSYPRSTLKKHAAQSGHGPSMLLAKQMEIDANDAQEREEQYGLQNICTNFKILLEVSPLERTI